jgi:hypothetical protein
MDKAFRKIILFILTCCLIFGLFGLKRNPTATPGANMVSTDSSLVTHPSHITFLWLENKDFDSIIGNKNAPFINSLVKNGTLFTNSHANTHPSYPNYVDFFAGAPNGIKDDACIDSDTLTTPNLYTILKAVGKSFGWYSEDLPTTGSKVCSYENYDAKHNPTTIFNNVPGSVNKRFADFPTNYNHLENIVCISPNELDDMHSASIQQGDTWVKEHLSRLINWCTTHNSIFVIYFDESGIDPDNRIPVIAIGQHVKANYQLNTIYDHFSWTKTVSVMFSAPEGWTDNVAKANLITGCWK